MKERGGGNGDGIPKSHFSSNCNKTYMYILKIKTKFAIHFGF